jgi:hypothetical protein
MTYLSAILCSLNWREDGAAFRNVEPLNSWDHLRADHVMPKIERLG